MLFFAHEQLATCQERWTNALGVFLRQYEHPFHPSSVRLGDWGTVAVVYLFSKRAYAAWGDWIPAEVVTGSWPWLWITEIFSCAPGTCCKSRSQLQLGSCHGCLPHERRLRSMRQSTVTSPIRFSLASCKFIDSKASREGNETENLTCENKWLLLKEFIKLLEITRC